MSVEVLSVIFNMTIQLLLLAFVFAILHRFAWRPFLAYLSARQTAITSLQVAAQQERELASQLVIEAQTKITEATLQAAAIVAQAEEAAQQELEQKQQAIKSELKRRQVAAEQQLEQNRIRLEEEMQQTTVEVASTLAAQFLQSQASATTTATQIETFLEKMGEE